MSAQEVIAFPSGLHALLFEDHRFPVVHIALTHEGGFAASPAAEPQTAHVVEHLVFRTDADEGTYEERLAALGCAINGTTTLEFTNYLASCPAASGEAALSVILGLLDRPLTGLTDADVALENRIVHHESAFREDTFLPVYQESLLSLYGDAHPYGRIGVGDERVPGVTLDAAIAYHAAHATPEHAAIALVGDFDRSTVAKALAAHPTLIRPGLTLADQVTFSTEQLAFLDAKEPFGWYADAADPRLPQRFSATRTPTHRPPLEPGSPATLDRTVEAPVTDPLLVVSWALPGATMSNFFQLDQLGDAASGELQGALGAGSDASCWVETAHFASTLLCALAVEDERDARTQARTATRVFERAWTWHQENRVEQGLSGESRYSVALARDEGGTATARSANAHFLLTDLGLYNDQKYGAAGAFLLGDYLAMREDYLRRDLATTLYVRPAGMPVDDAPDVAAIAEVNATSSSGEPHSGPLSDLLAAREEVPLDNGFRAVLVQANGGYGFASLLFRQPEGWSRELAALVDPYVIAPAKFHKRPVEFRSVYPWYRGDYTYAGYMMPAHLYEDGESVWFTLRAAYDTAVPVPISAAHVRRRLEQTARAWRLPSYWVRQGFVDAYAGGGAVYGPDPAETLRVADASMADLTAYLRAKYAPENATLLVVGPYDDQPLDDAIIKRFAPWRRTDNVAPPSNIAATPAPDRLQAPPSTFVITPLVPQSEAEIALACPVDLPADPADALATRRVLTQLLSITARRSVREETGSAYVVDADVTTANDPGGALAILSAAITMRDAAAARALFEQALDHATAHPEDLATAQYRAWAGARVSNDSIRATRNTALGLLGTGVPLAAFDDYGARLSAVDAAAVSRALAPCVGHTTYGVIGDPAVVGAAFDAAGVPWRTYDWAAAVEARLEALPSGIADDERAWYAEHR